RDYPQRCDRPGSHSEEHRFFSQKRSGIAPAPGGTAAGPGAALAAHATLLELRACPRRAGAGSRKANGQTTRRARTVATYHWLDELLRAGNPGQPGGVDPPAGDGVAGGARLDLFE